jgi:hypothetical protein
MRSLNGRLRVSMFTAVLLPLVLLTAMPVFGATIIVTNTNDSGPGSLRAAIAAASPGDTIKFDLDFPATITLASPLTISISLTIKGPGASNLAVSGGNAVIVFEVTGGALTISRLTIENGNAPGPMRNGGGIFNEARVTLIDSTLSDNFAFEFGGGIYNAATGNLTVRNSTFLNNSNGFGGGGIANAGMASVMGSSFSFNHSTCGGAVYNEGTITIADSTISINGGNPLGGGICNASGALIINDTTVSSNSAVHGGNIYSDFPGSGGTVTIKNSTISDGNADISGPGIQSSGILTIVNSTISGNRGDLSGGIEASGTTTITNSTIAGNQTLGFITGGGAGITGTATIKNTILAGNVNGTAVLNCSGTLTSDGHNLSDDNSCADFFTGPGDLNNTPSGLDPAGLKNNGGPTKTIALLKTSPAVDAIPVIPDYCTLPDGTTPVATDQRGFLRPQGPACDIGAFEYTTPAEAIQSLLRHLDTLDLRDRIEDGLSAILEAALDSLQRGNNGAAENHLNIFLLRVSALSENERLTRQDAAQLIRQVQLILQILGAGNGPTPCLDEGLRAECEKESD